MRISRASTFCRAVISTGNSTGRLRWCPRGCAEVFQLR